MSRWYSGESPYWRFLVTTLGTETLTVLDRLASGRTVTYVLNHPAEASGFVPSDSPEINILHTDGYPFLAEGVRLLYGFRRLNAPPDTNIWMTAFAGRIELLEDGTRENDGQSHYTAYDPWRYWHNIYFYGATEVGGSDLPIGDIVFTNPTRANIVVRTLLQMVLGIAVEEFDFSIFGPSVFLPAGFPLNPSPLYVDYRVGQGNDATVEADPLTCFQSCDYLDPGFTIPQGTSLGEALEMVVATGKCDIVLEPTWKPIDIPNPDPLLNVVAAPGVLCTMDVVPLAGSDNYNAVFSWDLPGRSLRQVSDLIDGTQRANRVQSYAANGGRPVTPQIDSGSTGTYGSYEAQGFKAGIDGQGADNQIEVIAWSELILRRYGKETVTISPMAERAPLWGRDYTLGDRVPVYYSNNLRQALSGVMRVYGIPVAISDDALETVDQLICAGDFYGGAAPGAGGSSTDNPLNVQTAVNRGARGARSNGVVQFVGGRRF